MTLRRWRVRTVVVGPMAGQSRVVAWLTQVLKERPTWYGTVAVWQLPSSPLAGRAAPVAHRSSHQFTPRSARYLGCPCAGLRSSGQGE